MEIAQVGRDEYLNLAQSTLSALRSSVELSQRNNLEGRERGVNIYLARGENFNLAQRTLSALRSSVELSQRNNLERGESAE